MKTNKNIHFVYIFILGCRLAFIFSNAFNNNLKITNIQVKPQIQETLAQNIPATPENKIIWNQQNKINMSKDIKILETTYNSNKDMKIGKLLIEKLAQNYEFEKANQYLKELMSNTDYDQSIDATLHLYIAIHDPTIVSITDPQSIQKIIPIMNTYKNEARLSEDDYHFYQWLIEIWNKNYKWAREIFNGIKSPNYQTAIQSITQAISKYDSTKAIPRYYQDALVSLSLLKNGYFSIAKKLALEVALEDNKYILPYQILAYTQFLTNNREAANDYFLKLADVDTSNQSLYKFLIWIGFYRSKDYEQSILYLSQVDSPELQTDSYRYLILGYIATQDTTSMTQIQQKILWQADTTKSDYYDYFYQTFYKPYRTSGISTIDENNKLLAEMYLTNCTTKFTGDNSDICTYGKIGMDLTKHILSTDDINAISTLANTYKEPYLFSIIGDLYRQDTNSDKQTNLEQAKNNYAKAISLSTDTQEQATIRSKLSQIE